MPNLRDLGLSEYEARAFRSLLDTGPTTAKELSRASDVPMGRIYDVLNSLETLNLVRSQAASRPKKFVAVEPETALDRLLEDRKRQLEEKASQYESIVDELADQMESADPVDEPFWTAAVGPEETVDLLVERLAAADDRIVMVGSVPSQQFDVTEAADRIVDEIERALERGVEVFMLLPPAFYEHIPTERGRDYQRRLQNYDRFNYRASDEITSTFELIDDVEVCIEVPHPMGGSTFAMIDLKDPEFADEVYEEFRPQWDGARRVSGA
ncbi:Sugar-specific transcriptional regulator TrmB [Halomicrobium zhouii]|uniref:Sugar-specific transcriptional regulator TrmB n=1 Tax=Halomicrobium zhouii TaxID=767519 RepID=A0A1I6LA50_9EURY|nr:helix-turn-helix domain-containing protein [Halomicrobium zhouii]SFS00274.1 Sugar-specific transcriptional regulator TrmB [Halomicrobium zhouii]